MFIFIMAFSLSLGLLNFFCCIIAITLIVYFDKKLVPLYTKQNELDNHVGSVLFDYISNITTILTLCLNKLTKNNLLQRMIVIEPFYRMSTLLNEIKWFSVGMILIVLQTIVLIGYILYSLKHLETIFIGNLVMIFRYQWDLNDVFFNFTSNIANLFA